MRKRWVLGGGLALSGLCLLALPLGLFVATAGAPVPGLRLTALAPQPALACEAAGCTLDVGSTSTYAIAPDEPAAQAWCRERLLAVYQHRPEVRAGIIDVTPYERVHVPMTEQFSSGPAVIVAAAYAGCQDTVRITHGLRITLHFP